ncbi:MAG: DUF6034 family protein, partial [Bacteroides sp.]|nr:DUF6034 family protein [Bacteroides sp.]MCM1549985.1 DUF6034 family protein [Clostridium sp.]
QDFLAELGITNMETQYVTDIYLFHDYSSRSEVYLGRKGWQIYMYWGTEDMSDDFLPENYWTKQTLMSNSKEATLPYEMHDAYLNELYGEENYGEIRAWNGVAVFTVLDDGIIDAWIQNPVENKELLAEHVTLLEFDQVFKQGLAQLETLYGDSGTGPALERKDIKITVIELNYARMQSPNTEGEFAMIPVWDFKTGPDGESMVSINAIDGSVFDRRQGY